MNRNSGIGRLKEHQGTKCPNCELVYFDGVKACPDCGAATLPAKWYSRFCLERLAFILTLVLLAAVVAPLLSDEPDVFYIAPLVTALILFSLYSAANFFLGIGRFKETFVEDALPSYAGVRFSWGRYASELIRIVGIFVAVVLFAGLVALVRTVVSSAFD